VYTNFIACSLLRRIDLLFVCCCIVARSISNDNIIPVCGIATLNDELFVVRSPNKEHIEVYDVEAYALRRRLAVAGLSDVIKGMTSCAMNNCLYVSDSWKNAVHRIELAGDGRYRTLWWRVDRRPMGLSVNADNNVLVSFWTRPFRIHEYTTGGSLVREIRLQSTLEWPLHATQLASGQFVVSHGFGNSSHRVCIVDERGRAVLSYGGRSDPSLGQLAGPKQLAVDARSGSIIVADSENHRLIVLDRFLNRSRDLGVTVDVDGGLRGPYALHLDEARDRLYVGEWMGGRVHAIDRVGELLRSLR